MRKVGVFIMVSADGYYEGPNHELDWPISDEESRQFGIDQSQTSELYLFGRRTYELMKRYWPTEVARRNDPIMAERMDSTHKIVFSRSLTDVDWVNTRLVRNNAAKVVSELKSQPGKAITVLGSSDLCVFLLENELLDEVSLLVSPVLLGEGRPLFTGLKRRLRLQLVGRQEFRNGSVLLNYRVMY
jgi:dihydrofolate reductase